MIGQKLMIDSSDSTDSTPSIGVQNGWTVIRAPKLGIAAKANKALQLIRTPFFATIEADILLPTNWLPRLLNRIKADDRIAVAQGIRLPTDEVLQLLFHRKDRGVAYSLDNNLYRTAAIRSIGGFPEVCRTCSDGFLKQALENAGYLWVIDTGVVSGHIRDGIRSYWKHWVAMQALCTCSNKHYGRLNASLLRSFVSSPIRAVILAAQYRVPRIILVYPYHRWKTLEVGLRHMPYVTTNQFYGKEIVY